jgi:hypothetical protein
MIVPGPVDPDAAEQLLGQVSYRADVTLHEYTLNRRDNIGTLIINAFILIGILLGFAILSGAAVGGLMAFRRRQKDGEPSDALTTLNL